MDPDRGRPVMDIPMALVVLAVTGLGAAGMVVWLARRDRRSLLAFVAALFPGALAGIFILDQGRQPGTASLNGALAAAALGVVVLAILIIALVVRRLRVPAASISASLVLSAVMASQLIVYLEYR